MLGSVRERLGNPPTIALTATATVDVRQDIIDQLYLSDFAVFVTGFDRLNLLYESCFIIKVREKHDQLLELIQHNQDNNIIYCATRKTINKITSFIQDTFKNRPIFAY